MISDDTLHAEIIVNARHSTGFLRVSPQALTPCYYRYRPQPKKPSSSYPICNAPHECAGLYEVGISAHTLSIELTDLSILQYNKMPKTKIQKQKENPRLVAVHKQPYILPLVLSCPRPTMPVCIENQPIKKKVKAKERGKHTLHRETIKRERATSV